MSLPDTNDARISVLEAELRAVKVDISEIRVDAKEARAEIHEMRTDLARRPTWAVATVIGVLSSSCVGLLVALATNTA